MKDNNDNKLNAQWRMHWGRKKILGGWVGGGQLFI